MTIVTGWDVHGMSMASQLAAINKLNADEMQNKKIGRDICKMNYLNHYGMQSLSYRWLKGHFTNNHHIFKKWWIHSFSWIDSILTHVGNKYLRHLK